MTTRAMSVRVLPRQGGGQAATGQQRQENNAYSTDVQYRYCADEGHKRCEVQVPVKRHRGEPGHSIGTVPFNRHRGKKTPHTDEPHDHPDPPTHPHAGRACDDRNRLRRGRPLRTQPCHHPLPQYVRTVLNLCTIFGKLLCRTARHHTQCPLLKLF